MGSLPTRRLIDATAKLDPADRALLNLWLNRGFDDRRLATLTGMTPEAVIGRRERLIGRLSDDLALPPADIQEALREITTTETNGRPALGQHAEASSTNGHGNPDKMPGIAAGLLLGPAALLDRSVSSNGSGLLLGPAALEPRPMPTPEPTATMPAGLLLGPAAVRPADNSVAPEAPPEPAARPEPADAPEPAASPQAEARTGSRRRTARLSAALVILAGVIALVLLVTEGSNASHRPRPRAQATTAAGTPQTSTAASTPTATTSPAPTVPQPRPARPGPIAFAGLPGGLMHTRGTVQILGPVHHLRLRLTVRGLPAAHHGHYQVWLFNSVLDSQSLGRLRAGVRAASYRLPTQARRYRWIDVSLQPPGYVNHSGESELRAANPAHTSLARLNRPAARRRHQLRRAKTGSKRASTSK